MSQAQTDEVTDASLLKQIKVLLTQRNRMRYAAKYARRQVRQRRMPLIDTFQKSAKSYAASAERVQAQLDVLRAQRRELTKV